MSEVGYQMSENKCRQYIVGRVDFTGLLYFLNKKSMCIHSTHTVMFEHRISKHILLYLNNSTIL